MPKDDVRDSSSWSSPPLMLLRDIHSKLITQYEVVPELVLMDIYVILMMIDRSINEVVPDKIRKYRSDYNNNSPNTVSFIPSITSEFVRLLFLQSHRETDLFFASSVGVHLS
jgi:hypothetical protein